MWLPSSIIFILSEVDDIGVKRQGLAQSRGTTIHYNY